MADKRIKSMLRDPRVIAVQKLHGFKENDLVRSVSIASCAVLLDENGNFVGMDAEGNPTTPPIATDTEVAAAANAAQAAAEATAAADATSKANAAQAAAEATAAADATSKANAAQAAAEATASADATSKANAAQAAAEAASVPYTGATGNVNLDSYTLDAATLGASQINCDYLYSLGGTQAADFSTFTLYDYYGYPALEFGYRYGVDYSGQIGFDWDYRFLGDTNGYTALDWANRQLVDASSSPSLDWEYRELLDPGYNPIFSWNLTGGVGPMNGNALIFASTDVSSLPPGQLGSTMVVTDATSPSVGSVVSGGGSDNCLVTHNGSDWIVIALL